MSKISQSFSTILVALVQEVGCWLWENTRHEEAEADLVFLNENLRQVIGEDKHPESLLQPELNDHDSFV